MGSVSIPLCVGNSMDTLRTSAEAEQVGIVYHAGLGCLLTHQTNTYGCPGARVQDGQCSTCIYLYVYG